MAKQKSKRKAQAQHKQKVEKQRKIMADQETDVVGNNGEPEPAEINEDAQKDEQMLTSVPESTDPVLSGDELVAEAHRLVDYPEKTEAELEQEQLEIEMAQDSIGNEILEEFANYPDEKVFDLKSAIADILKKYGA